MTKLSVDTSREPANQRVSLRELDHVFRLAGTLSFKDAAAACGISQSALSQSIANIEKRLGIPLFNRTRRRVAVTTYGETIARYADTVFGDLHNMQIELDGLRDAHRGSLSFGMGLFASAHLLNPVLTTFNADHPSVQLHTSVAHIKGLQDELEREEIEFYVAARDPQYSNDRHISELLYREELVAACRPDHPLAQPGGVSARELLEYPLIGYGRDDFLKRQIRPLLTSTREFNLLDTRYPAIAIQQPWTLAEFANHSDYLLLATRSPIKPWLDDGRLVPVNIIDLDLRVDMELVTREGPTPSPVRDAMIETIRDVIRQQNLD